MALNGVHPGSEAQPARQRAVPLRFEVRPAPTVQPPANEPGTQGTVKNPVVTGATAQSPGEFGALVRARRVELGLTLGQLAEKAGCAKSYLSLLENGHRRPPDDFLVDAIERALQMPVGRLAAAARWERTPPPVRREVARLESMRRQDGLVAKRLTEILSSSRVDSQGRLRGSLDEAYRSGELRAIVERLSPEDAARIENASREGVIPVALPAEIPLINKVAAGYPREFTDLGYPARVADEYVRCPDVSDPDAFAARVVGHSMMPVYTAGDIVVFSPARTVKSGNDCFVRLEENAESTFKRIYFEKGAGGEELIRLQPLNSAFAPRVVAREDVAGLYAAVRVIKELG